MNLLDIRNLGSVDIFIEYYLIQYVKIASTDTASWPADVGQPLRSSAMSRWPRFQPM